MQGLQAKMRFQKQKQREEETINKNFDDLEMLRRRSKPEESNSRTELAVALKLMDGVKSDGFKIMLAVHQIPLQTNTPTPE